MLKPKKPITILIATVISMFGLSAQNNKPGLKLESHFKMPAGLTPGDYIEKTVIVKVLPQFRSVCSADKIENILFKTLFGSIGGKSLVKKFLNI